MDLIVQGDDYIPTTDAGARDWLNNFASIIQQNPAAVGLDFADSAVISGLASDYDAAYVLAKTPSSRTAGTVANKDSVKAQSIATARVYAQQIKMDLGVTDQQKIDLGIHLNDETKTPVPTPVTVPLLAIISAESGVHTLRFADSDTPTSRAKPDGASQLQLFVAIEDQPTADVTNAVFQGVHSTQPIQVAFTPDKAGKTASYFGRWQTQRGLVGNWSLPVAMVIAFGGPVELQSAAA